MGRPRKSEPRDRQLNLSLTASELASIRRRAEAVGVRPVQFGRSVLLAHHPSTNSTTDADNAAARLVHNQLVRLGNNLNQMVRHLNRVGGPLPADLEPLLNDIRQIITRGP